jgi:hypothetical protein
VKKTYNPDQERDEHGKWTKVITMQSPRGETVDVTEEQHRQLTSGERKLRDSTGEDFATVSHGLHRGIPTHKELP